MRPSELMDMVKVKNRIVDHFVRVTHDASTWEWQPGEAKIVPRKLGEWLRDHSLYHFSPGDVNEGLPAESHYKLALFTLDDKPVPGFFTEDLLYEEVAAVKELLKVENMPETRMIDPQTGKPLRRVYIDPRSTGAKDGFAAKERTVTRQVSSAIVHDAAERIADAAQGASEAEIVAAVSELTGVAQS